MAGDKSCPVRFSVNGPRRERRVMDGSLFVMVMG